MIRLHLPLAIILGILASSAGAQDKSSHGRIGSWGGGRPDPAKALEMQKALQSQLGLTPVGANPNVDPVLVKRLLDSLQKDGPEGLQRLLGNNPELANQLRNLAKDDPELKRQLAEHAKSAGDQAKLKEMVEKLQASSRPGGGSTAPLPQGPAGDPMQPTKPGSPASSNAPTPPSANPPAAGQSGDAAPPVDPARAERFRQFVKRLDRMVPSSFKESDAMKRLGRRLTDMDWNKLSRTKVIPDSLRPKLDLERRLNGAERMIDRSIGRLDGRRMPNLANVRGPNLPNSPTLPSMGAPSAQEAGGAVTTVVTIGAIVAGIYLAWRLLIQPARERGNRSGEWTAGNWPVDPSRVRTREELVKAFDHLALLRGGKIARHWNHQTVANRLGTDGEVQRVTAQRLAMIYEQARYTPPQEPLPDLQLDLARRDLVALAGAAKP